MTKMDIQLIPPQRCYCPGEKIRGAVSWQVERSLRRVCVQLVWQTAGVGTRNTAIGDQVVIENPPMVGEESFELTAPLLPHSFTGRWVSFSWILTAVTEPSTESARIEMIISPTHETLRPDAITQDGRPE